ncbi:MAG: endonuclease/exonuclease/phosphatase family protein [Bacteroidetes bacterium]|nr:endonuclease/exonuclease/phosphatase family protein [Bacteroidota bacterium]
MKRCAIPVLVFLLFYSGSTNGNGKRHLNISNQMVTGFWNLENFMDTIDDPGLDSEFTPGGFRKWNTEKFTQKVRHLQQVISAMHPDIMGFAEVEHKNLIALLLQAEGLKMTSFGIVHFESPDERGIDVALIYNKEKLKELYSEKINVRVSDSDATRNILYVKLAIINHPDTLHVFVNHWPSRRGGQERSAQKRMKAANTLMGFVRKNKLFGKKTIFLGDFNDDPADLSISKGLKVIPQTKNTKAILTDSVYISLNQFHSDTIGTLSFGGKWNMFDQIIINMESLYPPGHTPGMYAKPGGEFIYKNNSFKIFGPEWMCDTNPKYKGQPLRTFAGKKWLNGYSDHFPVMATFQYE